MNWSFCGNLIMSLYERASRYRLQTVIPGVVSDKPSNVKSTSEYVNSLEAIQDFAIVSRESLKRFGAPKTFSELVECIKTTVKDRNVKTPFMRGLLHNFPRIFRQSKILPGRVSQAFNSNAVILDAIRAGYLNLILMGKKFTASECEVNSDSYATVNLNLLKRAFPRINREARLSLYLD